jgi:hypothetical protein
MGVFASNLIKNSRCAVARFYESISYPLLPERPGIKLTFQATTVLGAHFTLA